MHNLRWLPFQTNLRRKGFEDQPDRSADQPEGRGHQAVHGGGLEKARVNWADLSEHDAAGV